MAVVERVSAHKAWIGGILAAVSAAAGLAVGAMGLVDPADVVAATDADPERLQAWWKISWAILTVIAGGGATGAAVWKINNRPKP